MLNKKAFTLVELLAVIVIIAVISLIAVPVTINIINESKENADKSSIELFMRSFENSLMAKRLDNGNFNPDTCNVENGVVTCDGVTLEVEGKNIDRVNGIMHLDNKKVKYYDLNVGGFFYSEGHTDEKCFQYTISNNEVTITKYYKNIGNDSSNNACPLDVIIPDSIDGKRVTNIGTRAFRTAPKITSVVIPNSVINIESEAFAFNDLTEIRIPDNVTNIGNSAFRANNISNISFSTNLIIIGSSAFSYNQLTSVEIPDSVTTIGSTIFSCNGLTSVVIGSGIKTISGGAFNLDTSCDSIHETNQITSMIIDAHEEDVSIGPNSFDSCYSICWLKDTPTCGS